MNKNGALFGLKGLIRDLNPKKKEIRAYSRS